MCVLALIAASVLSAQSAHGLERSTAHDPLLGSKPVTPIRLEKSGRMPASVAQIRSEQEEERKGLDEKLKMGTFAIIRNSTEDWNNLVVRVVARYEDGSRQVELPDKKKAMIRFENLNTLSPETSKCCKSNGVDICTEDKVYHPVPSSSIDIPQGRVRRLFENCTALVRDGLDFIYDTRQIGKAVDCSPQKETVCVGKVVLVEAYRNGKRFSFEGPVEQVFTNGTIIVRSGLWRMPVEAVTAKVQTDTLYSVPAGEDLPGAVITSRDGQRKIFSPTQPEIEPYDANDTQMMLIERGITVPAR
jgi:hypothetical protein